MSSGKVSVANVREDNMLLLQGEALESIVGYCVARTEQSTGLRQLDVDKLSVLFADLQRGDLRDLVAAAVTDLALP
jgi:hypothetical protein